MSGLSCQLYRGVQTSSALMPQFQEQIHEVSCRKIRCVFTSYVISLGLEGVFKGTLFDLVVTALRT